jgi:GxxExxY protein
MLIVDQVLLVEIKSVDSFSPICDAQLLTYLKLGEWKVGLMINFNVELLKHGIRRKVLGFSEGVS